MQIYTDFSVTSNGESAVALGYFDGLHLAHRKIIKYAVYSGRKFIPTVFTFTLDDGEYKGASVQKALMSYEEKIEAFEEMGVYQLFIPKFSDIKSISAEDFFYEILLKKMRAGKLICGFNFRFGSRNSGDVLLLKKLCEQNDVELVVVDEMSVNGEAISSTAIRSALVQGDCEKIKTMLGEHYSLSGEVVHGAALGRKLSFPTLNQTIEENRALPKFGVYISTAEIDGVIHNAITNVGIKPTVGGQTPCAETHLINFEGDLYGERAKIRLIKFLREEKQFDSLEALKSAVFEDITAAENFFKK